MAFTFAVYIASLLAFCHIDLKVALFYSIAVSLTISLLAVFRIYSWNINRFCETILEIFGKIRNILRQHIILVLSQLLFLFNTIFSYLCILNTIPYLNQAFVVCSAGRLAFILIAPILIIYNFLNTIRLIFIGFFIVSVFFLLPFRAQIALLIPAEWAIPDMAVVEVKQKRVTIASPLEQGLKRRCEDGEIWSVFFANELVDWEKKYERSGDDYVFHNNKLTPEKRIRLQELHIERWQNLVKVSPYFTNLMKSLSHNQCFVLPLEQRIASLQIDASERVGVNQAWADSINLNKYFLSPQKYSIGDPTKVKYCFSIQLQKCLYKGGFKNGYAHIDLLKSNNPTPCAQITLNNLDDSALAAYRTYSFLAQSFGNHIHVFNQINHGDLLNLF